MEYKWVGNHPQDLASGLVLAPGETAELSDDDVRDAHNDALIKDGNLIPVGEGSNAAAPNATDDAIELAAAHELSLADVPGTGAAGRITKRDVEQHITSLEGSGD